LIEDGFATQDIIGIKKCIERFRSERPSVKIGINQMFKSNIDVIKEFT